MEHVGWDKDNSPWRSYRSIMDYIRRSIATCSYPTFLNVNGERIG